MHFGASNLGLKLYPGFKMGFFKTYANVRSHCFDFGYDSLRLTVDVFIVVSWDYMTPIKSSFECLRSFYDVATNINEFVRF